MNKFNCRLDLAGWRINKLEAKSEETIQDAPRQIKYDKYRSNNKKYRRYSEKFQLQSISKLIQIQEISIN